MPRRLHHSGDLCQSCQFATHTFKHDIPDAVVRFFDTGHFALETHAAEIAGAMRDSLAR